MTPNNNAAREKEHFLRSIGSLRPASTVMACIVRSPFMDRKTSAAWLIAGVGLIDALAHY